MTELFDELAKEASDLSSTPSDEDLVRLRKMGERMVSLEQEIADQEADIKSKRKELNSIKMTEMPALMEEIGTDHLGLPESGCDLVLSPYFKASIPKDWEESQREAAFQHLEELGADDIVRNIVTFNFGATEHNAVGVFLAGVDKIAVEEGIDLPDPVREKTVPWATLTSFVKEQVKKGQVVDLEKLNATVGSVVKIKKRKEN